ncbi:hypothetical protein RHS02_03221, partial [Rhizoctonia solani]
MNSPCIVVSQYKLPSHAIVSKGGHDLKPSDCASWLLNPQWPRRAPTLSQSSPDGHTQQAPFTTLTQEEVMERYRDTMFDFTFPDTVDFRDLSTGELAATHRSTLVVEHGWKLRELAEKLEQIPTTPDNAASLAKCISKIETSLVEIGLWVEEQMIQQLMQGTNEGAPNL